MNGILLCSKNKTSIPYMALMAFAMTGFVVIMTETIPAGLLPEISSTMSISLSSAGQWVTAYALGSLFAAIPLTVATRTWNRKSVLQMTAAGFLIFNTITAVSSNVYHICISEKLYLHCHLTTDLVYQYNPQRIRQVI